MEQNEYKMEEGGIARYAVAVVSTRSGYDLETSVSQGIPWETSRPLLRGIV